MRNCGTRLLVILFFCVCIFGCERVRQVVKPPVAVDLIPDPNLAAKVSDISSLANLTSLTELWLGENGVSDISPLANLTNLRNLYLSENQISDIGSLAANRGLGDSDILSLQGNPLDETAIRTHIPTLQKRGVRVQY